MSLWWINNNGINGLKGEPAFYSDDGTTFKTEIQASRYAMYSGQAYYPWTDSQGNPPNPDNPIQFPDSFILESIHTIRRAAEDFWKILPSLNPAEQDRLNALLERAPFVLTPKLSEQERLDRMQAKINSGVRTSGPHGGTRLGG